MVTLIDDGCSEKISMRQLNAQLHPNERPLNVVLFENHGISKGKLKEDVIVSAMIAKNKAVSNVRSRLRSLMQEVDFSPIEHRL